MPTRYRCPQCEKEFPDRGDFFPFCSERCKTLDLGNWAMERYRVPVTESNDTPQDETDD